MDKKTRSSAAGKRNQPVSVPVLRLWHVQLIDTLFIDIDNIGEPPTGDAGGVASSTVLDSWEDGASSTPEDGTAKPIVDNDIDIDIDTDIDGDEDKPKPIPKKVIEESEPKPKKEHINIVIIGHVGKCCSVTWSIHFKNWW